MTPNALSEQLAQIRAAHAASEASVADTLDLLRAEQAKARAELEALQQRLVTLAQEIRHHEARIEDERGIQLLSEIALVRHALGRSAASLIAAAPFWRDLHAVRTQIAALVEADPELPSLVEAFRRFEEKSAPMLDNLPQPYRDTLREAHDRLSKRLGPYLELGEREQGLIFPEAVELQIVALHDAGTGELHWALPFPSDPTLLPSEHAATLQTIAEVILGAITGLQRCPGWYVAEMSTGAWSGYASLFTLTEHTGTGSVIDAGRVLLTENLQRDPLLGRANPIVHVDAVTPEAWRLAADSMGSEIPIPPPVNQPDAAADNSPLQEQPEQSDPSQPSTPGTDERPAETPPKTPSRIPAGSPWYQDADLISWERPLKTTEGSQWSVQARRLRTLVMRMAATGKIGAETAPLTHLWRDLPPDHRQLMQQGIDRLMRRGVLVEGQVIDGQHTVALNPELLPELQSLINRDVTEFWSDLVATEG